MSHHCVAKANKTTTTCSPSEQRAKKKKRIATTTMTTTRAKYKQVSRCYDRLDTIRPLHDTTVSDCISQHVERKSEISLYTNYSKVHVLFDRYFK